MKDFPRRFGPRNLLVVGVLGALRAAGRPLSVSEIASATGHTRTATQNAVTRFVAVEILERAQIAVALGGHRTQTYAATPMGERIYDVASAGGLLSDAERAVIACIELCPGLREAEIARRCDLAPARVYNIARTLVAESRLTRGDNGGLHIRGSEPRPAPAPKAEDLAILDCLKRGVTDAADIASALAVSPRSVGPRLQRLANFGLAQRVAAGVWAAL